MLACLMLWANKDMIDLGAVCSLICRAAPNLTAVPHLNVQVISKLQRKFEIHRHRSIMDMSLSPILVNCQGVLNGDLLPNLPDGPLTQDVKGFNHNALRPGAGEREASTAYVKARNPNQAGYVISKIEDIFESIADSILNQKQELVIHLRNRRKPGPQNSATQVRSIKTYEVRFPSRSPQEAWKFSEYMSG